MSTSGRHALDVIAIEASIVVPDRPGDSHQLVRERYRGFVGMTGSCELQRPCLELGQGLVTVIQPARSVQSGSRPVHEEHAHIGIALFAGAAEAPSPARRVFPRREP